ncbi:MAG TPA: YiaA/YiaB family inner membrane protein [Pseudomonas sp.]|nr:YiaA/YiaB family inner membrane protein [Pseudomonas sp.]
MNPDMQPNSASWLFFTKASFVISLLATALGITFMPTDLTTKGYLALCGLFLVNSTITLSKTMRDQHEGERLINRISEARTQKILKEFSE